MSDYPKYFPKFMRDFHQLKYFSQSFFVYLDMMDKKKENFDEFFNKRRSTMCTWIDFTILLASLLDFLHWMGYDIRKTREPGEFVPTGIIEDMRLFPAMYSSLVDPDAFMVWTPESTKKMLEKYQPLIKHMPDDVIEAAKKLGVKA